jgi:hypothetical protein
MNVSPDPVTFTFTEESNALDYLEESRRFIERTVAAPAAWKWVTIALHGALYGFAICACRGTTNDRVVKKNKYGHEQLISVGQALKLCQVICKALVLTSDQKKSVRELSQIFRNRFEHHTPGSWTFFDDDFRPMCRNVIEVIRLLVRETGHVTLWRPGQGEKFDGLISECIALL